MYYIVRKQKGVFMNLIYTTAVDTAREKSAVLTQLKNTIGQFFGSDDAMCDCIVDMLGSKQNLRVKLGARAIQYSTTDIEEALVLAKCQSAMASEKFMNIANFCYEGLLFKAFMLLMSILVSEHFFGLGKEVATHAAVLLTCYLIYLTVLYRRSRVFTTASLMISLLLSHTQEDL
jgi:hypothetical protein